MPAYRFLLLCLALVLSLHSVVAVPHYAIRRQDGSSPDPSQVVASTITRSSRPSATIAPSVASSSPVSGPTTSEASARPSATVTSLSHVPAATASTAPSQTSAAANASKNLLPIHPRVTPAMGLTGALLLITGLVYAVIGIKNKWIHVFGSAAYLTALAVTVLIVYLMNPPVSDGVQGAFFVAAFFTGLIFGALSLVFSDITEGFGCLLGGFCLSMWFLSLKSGGLISSSTGRAIFIGCMTAGGYSLSFSHYTRDHALIASMSLSGATATILGIDCLARAGWKEFWLYLWSLNDDIFPLNTNTYPLTKNIKAELAGVVIIAIFGIVSQLRVWNMVKERREKNAAQELEKREETDRIEEAQGRIIEDRFQKERAQWEAAYGNKSNPDSSVSSSSIASPKGSASIQETETFRTGSVEMANMSKTGVASSGTTVTVNVLPEDDIQQLDAQGNPITYRAVHERHIPNVPESEPMLAKRSSVTKRASLQAVVSPPPAVVPLPFHVPTEDDLRKDDDGKSTVSTAPETDSETAANHGPISKRISDMSAPRRFSKNRASHVLPESSEALVEDHYVEEDCASSVAATLDDDNDSVFLREISPPGSPTGTEHNTAECPVEPEGIAGDDAPERPAYRQSLTTSTDPKSNEEGIRRSSLRDSRIRADTLMAGKQSASEQSAQSTTSDAQSQSGRAGLQIGGLKDAPITARLSKVALSYRTNEWAKHLEAAEKPDLDDLSAPASPNVMGEEVPEKAVPVSDEIAAPLMWSKRSSQRMSVDRAPSAIASSGVLSRSSSGTRLDALAPVPGNTLLGQREALMRKRTSSQSIALGASATNLLELADQEEMSLAQRRQMLQNHQSQSPLASPRRSPPSTSQKWQNKSWGTKGAPAGFDSHQPKRRGSSQSEQKREELYAGWRNTMRDVTPRQMQSYAVEQQRAAVWNERRQRELEKQQRESVQQQRASMLDSMMRSGQMMEAHREAMRKMQANASRNAC